MIKNKTICLLIAIGELIMSVRSHIRGDVNWEIAHWSATGLFLSVMFIIMAINREELLIKSQTPASQKARSHNSSSKKDCFNKNCKSIYNGKCVKFDKPSDFWCDNYKSSPS